MNPVLFVHGWGFDAGFWQTLLDRLPELSCSTVELGYRGAPVVVPAIDRPLVVAHSLGLAWALANIPRPWAGVVSVNGFARFTRTDDFAEGVAPRVVERMVSRFRQEPQVVATDFLARCGVADPDVADMAPEPLSEALSWLGICDERKGLNSLTCPLLALAGGDDVIVPPAMSRALFTGRELAMVEGAGHLLPLTHADVVAAQLQRLWEGLP
jgi:pimeloyl-[acyl-carrier protein] methyl ester esterase